jgi:hypothetical protein
MAAMSSFLTDTSIQLAHRWTSAFLRKWNGFLLICWMVVLSTVVAFKANPKQSLPERTLIGASEVVLGVFAFITVVWVLCLTRCPSAQRDAAHLRLFRIDNAIQQYKLVSVKGDLLEDRETGWPKGLPDYQRHGREMADVVRFFIENRGRGAQFAVLVQSLDRFDRPLDNPFAPLHWFSRSGAYSEEIPNGEKRVIGIAYLLHELSPKGELRMVLQAPSGSRYNTEYLITAGSLAIVNFQVSVRGEADVSFTQPFVVWIDWKGPGHKAEISKPSEDPKSTTYPHQDKIGSLFDYAVPESQLPRSLRRRVQP